MNYDKIRKAIVQTELYAALKEGVNIDESLLEEKMPDVDESILKEAKKLRKEQENGELYNIDSKLKGIAKKSNATREEKIELNKLKDSKLPDSIKNALLEREMSSPVVVNNPLSNAAGSAGQEYFKRKGLTKESSVDLDILEEITEKRKEKKTSSMLTEDAAIKLISKAQESLLEELLPDEGSAVIKIGDTIFQCKITGAKKIKK